jgi:tRNA (guanine37-N1)-methyltransferase
MPSLTATFITMFKEPMLAWLNCSLMARAQKNQIVKTEVISVLEHVGFNHHAIDDTPYGGGPGELMKIDVVAPLIKKALSLNPHERSQKRVILLDPSGRTFDQNEAKRLSTYKELIFVSGRYEGIDARIYHYVDEALSLGDFVLSSGDMAALTMFDATARMVNGFLGNSESIKSESHFNGRLEASLYTRPKDYEGLSVPKVYQSGDHQAIEKARLKESLIKTRTLRPDLLEKYPTLEKEPDLRPEDYPWHRLEKL